MEDLNRTLREINEKLLEFNLDISESVNKRLNSNEKEFFSRYFWNKEKRILRDKVQLMVIVFLEMDGRNHGISELVKSYIVEYLQKLENKGYITSHKDQYGGHFELTKQGTIYLKDRHPAPFILAYRILDAIPIWLKIIVTIVTFIAAIFGIYAFWDEYFSTRQ